jgi:D-galactarolactone cycloisomerase
VKIVDVRVMMLSAVIPPERRWRSDYGILCKNDAAIVVVETDEGITGYGPAQATPPVVKEAVENTYKPLLLGEDPVFVERLWEKMYSGSRAESALECGYAQPIMVARRGETIAAMSGVDVALWDIIGKSMGQPVYKLLGACRKSIKAYASGGWAAGERAGPEVAGYIAKGYQAVKMRASGEDGYSLRKTLKRLEAARRAVGEEVLLMIDAHGCLHPTEAVRLARGMEEYGPIGWFEEPTPADLVDAMAQVKSQTSIPLATGEVEFTRYGFRDLLAGKAVDIVQPDVGICGGITEARRIAAFASAHGVLFAPHVYFSGLIAAASIHLAMSQPNCIMFEVPQSPLPLLFEMFTEPLPVKDGMAYALDRPGLGVQLQPDLEKRFPYQPGFCFEA